MTKKPLSVQILDFIDYGDKNILPSLLFLLVLDTLLVSEQVVDILAHPDFNEAVITPSEWRYGFWFVKNYHPIKWTKGPSKKNVSLSQQDYDNLVNIQKICPKPLRTTVHTTPLFWIIRINDIDYECTGVYLGPLLKTSN